jgi:hypothetical protein
LPQRARLARGEALGVKRVGEAQQFGIQVEGVRHGAKARRARESDVDHSVALPVHSVLASRQAFVEGKRQGNPSCMGSRCAPAPTGTLTGQEGVRKGERRELRAESGARRRGVRCQKAIRQPGRLPVA